MRSEQLQSRKEFLMKEVEQVRKCYDALIEETRKLEKYAILVTGVTWSWCISHPQDLGINLLIWFPSIVVGLFGIRAAGVHHQARAARKYILKVEQMFALPDNMGWANEQIKNSKGFKSIVAVTAYFFG